LFNEGHLIIIGNGCGNGSSRSRAKAGGCRHGLMLLLWSENGKYGFLLYFFSTTRFILLLITIIIIFLILLFRIIIFPLFIFPEIFIGFFGLFFFSFPRLFFFPRIVPIRSPPLPIGPPEVVRCVSPWNRSRKNPPL